MNCQDLINIMSEGKPLDSAAHNHVATCSGCSAMLAALETPAPALDPNHLAQLGSVLAAGATAVQPLPSNPVLLSIGLSCWLAVAVIIAAVVGMYALPVLSGTQKLVYYVPLLLLAALFTRALVEQIVPGALRRIPSLLPPIMSFAAITLLVFYIYSDNSTDHFIEQGIPCLRLGTVTGILFGAVGALLLRRGYLTTPSKTIPLYGFFAGLCGVAVLALHCPLAKIPHILVWHLGAMLITGLLGFVAARIIETR